MLDTLPYADLLAIHNVLAEKPARRFDTRANGEKRTLALIEARGLTLEEAARLADVVLGASDGTNHEPPVEEPAEPGIEEPIESPEATPPYVRDHETTMLVAAHMVPLVKAIVIELTKPERPAYLTTFLRRLSGDAARAGSQAPRERQMTASQKTIVDLCVRPQGATGKELAEGCGWPSIAARATCRKLADRFGYTLEESPKANGRGISFRMVAKPAVEE
jgi:hypothetical protein